VIKAILTAVAAVLVLVSCSTAQTLPPTHGAATAPPPIAVTPKNAVTLGVAAGWQCPRRLSRLLPLIGQADRRQRVDPSPGLAAGLRCGSQG
jgi:hypothetical protein